MQTQSQEAFNKFKELGEAFSSLPNHNAFLVRSEDPNDDALYVNIEATYELPESDPMNQSINALMTFTGGLINNEGQHSYLYYELKRLGVRAVVTERDSFGPLGVKIQPPNTNWWLCYG